MLREENPPQEPSRVSRFTLGRVAHEAFIAYGDLGPYLSPRSLARRSAYSTLCQESRARPGC